VPCRAVPCRAVPCLAVLCRAVPCRAVPCWLTVRCSTVPRGACGRPAPSCPAALPALPHPLHGPGPAGSPEGRAAGGGGDGSSRAAPGHPFPKPSWMAESGCRPVRAVGAGAAPAACPSHVPEGTALPLLAPGSWGRFGGTKGGQSRRQKLRRDEVLGMGISLQQRKAGKRRALGCSELSCPFPTGPGLPRAAGLFTVFPLGRMPRRFWGPLLAADPFLQTFPGFCTPRSSQQAGAWFPLCLVEKSRVQESAGVVLCGEGSEGVCEVLGPLRHRGSARRWVPSGIGRAVPSGEAAGLPQRGLCQLPVPCPEEQSAGWEIPSPASPRDRGRQVSRGEKGVAWRGDVSARCGEVAVPPARCLEPV